MATDIVQGLFGMTPESYQQQRDATALQQAAAFGRMDPMQAARTSIYYGANQLGGAIGGMLGAEDPQMRLISQRNALAKQIDMNDPESIMRGAQMAAQSGDTAAATALANYARKAAVDLSTIQQKTAEKMTPEQRNAIAESQLTDRLDQLSRLPQSPERDRAINSTKNQLTALTRVKPDKISDAIQVSRELGILTDELGKTQKDTPEYNNIKAQIDRLQKSEKTPSQLDIEKAQIYRQTLIDAKAPASLIAEVDAYIVGIAKGKGTVVQNVMPGQKEFVDIPKFRATVQNTIDPQLKVIDATDNALAAIIDSITNNNPISFNAAKVQLAKSLGDSQLSRRDVEAAGGDPSIYGKLIDTTSEFFTSTPSIDTQRKIQSTLNVVRNLNAKKAANEIDVQKKIAARQNYNPDAVAEALDFPQLKSKTTVGTGSFNDVEKERRYQEYKRQQSGAKP